jgi:hypothetical protein
MQQEGKFAKSHVKKLREQPFSFKEQCKNMHMEAFYRIYEYQLIFKEDFIPMLSFKEQYIIIFESLQQFIIE